MGDLLAEMRKLLVPLQPSVHTTLSHGTATVAPGAPPHGGA